MTNKPQPGDDVTREEILEAAERAFWRDELPSATPASVVAVLRLVANEADTYGTGPDCALIEFKGWLRRIADEIDSGSV